MSHPHPSAPVDPARSCHVIAVRYCAMARGEKADDEVAPRLDMRRAIAAHSPTAGGAIVGYGAFLLLSSATVAEAIESNRNVELVHVVVTNADDMRSVFGAVDDQIELTLGTIVNTLTRATDLIGRADDSSYSILIEGAPRGAGLLLADRIVRAAEHYNTLRGRERPIDVSCEILDGAAMQQLSDVFDITL